MIKGVNKQIIEISQTGSRYFERALLFVRPEYIGADSARLKDEAHRIIEGLGAPPHAANTISRPDRVKQRSRQKKKRALRAAIIVFLGIAACLVLYFVLNAII
ncbi:MAG TPA: hypothetical protein DEQ02_08005 [Ruminococcaceae bacterium]|nr:hypothetical protein [Oscillospiraceae bacterium]